MKDHLAGLQQKVVNHLTRNELSQAYFYASRITGEIAPEFRLSLTSLFSQLGLFRKAKQTLAPLCNESLPAELQVELLITRVDIANAQHDFTAAENWRREILDVLRNSEQTGSLLWVQSLIAWAGSVAATGDLYKAISIYQEAAAVKSSDRGTSHFTWRSIGCCYRDLGCFDLAEEAFDAALDIDDDPTIRTYLRDVHAARNLEIHAADAEDRSDYWALRYEQCETAQTLVRTRFNYQASQGNIESTAAYAHQLIQLKRLHEANRVLHTQGRLAKDTADWRLSKAFAQLALSQGDLAQAGRYCDTAAQAASFQPRLQCKLGSVLQLLEQHDAAYDCYKGVVEKSDGAGKRVVASAYTQMGHLNRIQQRYKGAARCYANAVELEPRSNQHVHHLEDAQAAARLVKQQQKNG